MDRSEMPHDSSKKLCRILRKMTGNKKEKVAITRQQVNTYEGCCVAEERWKEAPPQSDVDKRGGEPERSRGARETIGVLSVLM